MTAPADGWEESEPQLRQEVHVESGFAYGVIGADLHVFADRGPLYVLRQHRPTPSPTTDWLLAQPSRLLNARYAIVGFTGRELEQAALTEWRQDSAARLAVRWLHAPGGQGKTRLANELARQTTEAGWKVVSALHGPGSIHLPPDSEDLRVRDAAGVLLVVDYADRWPTSHLSWLFSNAMLHQPVPARVLLLARSASPWPMIRAELDGHEATTSEQFLAPLQSESGDRERMFAIACTAFANHYGSVDARGIVAPSTLDNPDFGLTLAIHMAALVAVDAAARARRPPTGMAALSAYLLDRERAQWATVFESRAEALGFETPPDVMGRVVFTAVLTGPVSHQDGKTILSGLGLDIHPERLLADHAICYPQGDARVSTVLEPLYPDRLAEDYVALSLPGHDVGGHPADPWAASATRDLLTTTSGPGLPDYPPRAIALLTAAATRWQHVGPGHLYPLLRSHPALAIEAGSSTLTGLAALPAVPVDLLEAIEGELSPRRHTDLDVGIADLSLRLMKPRLDTTTDPAAHATVYSAHATRLANAGRHREALTAAEEAVKIRRRLAATDAVAHAADLAASLTNLGTELAAVGRLTEALTATEEAVTLFRTLTADDRAVVAHNLGGSLTNLGAYLGELGRPEDALRVTKQAVALYRELRTRPDLSAIGRELVARLHGPALAASLTNLGAWLARVGRIDDALAASEEAVGLYRDLAADEGSAFVPDLASALLHLGGNLSRVKRLDEALAATAESVALYRDLAAANTAAFTGHHASSLVGFAELCVLAERELGAAVVAAEQAVTLYRELASRNAAAFTSDLARALRVLADVLSAAGRAPDESMAAHDAAVALYRQLAAADPSRFTADLAALLPGYALGLLVIGRHEEAMAATDEAVDFYRALAASKPTTFTPGLASSLYAYAHVRGAVGVELPKALEAATRSTELYKRLAEEQPETYMSIVREAQDMRATVASLAETLDMLGYTTMAEVHREMARTQNAPRTPPAP